eukprot:5944943-Prymnesium_polylepis.1
MRKFCAACAAKGFVSSSAAGQSAGAAWAGHIAMASMGTHMKAQADARTSAVERRGSGSAEYQRSSISGGPRRPSCGGAVQAHLAGNVVHMQTGEVPSSPSPRSRTLRSTDSRSTSERCSFAHMPKHLQLGRISSGQLIQPQNSADKNEPAPPPPKLTQRFASRRQVNKQPPVAMPVADSSGQLPRSPQNPLKLGGRNGVFSGAPDEVSEYLETI